MRKNNVDILDSKPSKIQEWRSYPKGSLLENGLALNFTATYIWDSCNGINTVKDIAKKLAKKYEIDDKQAQIDTLECIVLLHKEGGLAI